MKTTVRFRGWSGRTDSATDVVRALGRTSVSYWWSIPGRCYLLEPAEMKLHAGFTKEACDCECLPITCFEVQLSLLKSLAKLASCVVDSAPKTS